MKQILLSFLAIGGFVSLSFGQLYDNTANAGGSGVISCYMVDLDTMVQCADDFIIPTGGTWDVDAVTFRGFRNAATGGAGLTMDSVTVEIFSDAAGSPGTAIYSATHQLGAGGVPVPQGDTAITVMIPTQNLTEGTYWLSVYGYAESDERWNWISNTSADGSNGYLEDADDFFGAGATSWTDITTLGLTDPDFAFQIGGTGYMASIAEEDMIDVTIFPNPVVDFVQINANETVTQVSIFNINGQRVGTVVNPQENKIDVTELPNGTYIAEISTANGIAQVKFVK